MNLPLYHSCLSSNMTATYDMQAILKNVLNWLYFSEVFYCMRYMVSVIVSERFNDSGNICSMLFFLGIFLNSEG